MSSLHLKYEEKTKRRAIWSLDNWNSGGNKCSGYSDNN